MPISSPSFPGSGDDDADGALFRKCWAAIQAARGARGAAANYGRQLYGAFLAQGLVDVGAEGVSRSPRADRR